MVRKPLARPVDGDDEEQNEQPQVRHRRQANTRFPFGDEYALRNKFEQQLASLQFVPIFGNLASVPSWPPFEAVNPEELQEEAERTDSVGDALRAAQNKFAEWILATHIPWARPGYSYADVAQEPVERFATILEQLENGSFLREADGSYRGPPGYEELSLRADSDEAKGYMFSQRCLAMMIATSFGRGLRRPRKDTQRLQIMHRGRAAQQWNHRDPEQLLLPVQHARNSRRSRGRGPGGEYDPEYDASDEEKDGTDRATADDILQLAISLNERLLAANAHGVDEPTGLAANTIAFQNHMHDMYFQCMHNESLDPAGNLIQEGGGNGIPPENDFPVLQMVPHMDQDDVVDISNRMIEEPPVPPIVLPPVNQPPPPPILQGNDSRPGAAEVSLPVHGRAWQALQQMSNPAAERVPNPHQMNVLTDIGTYFDLVDAQRPTPPLRIFLEGPAGVGKSFVFQCVETMAHAIGRHIVVCALTGSACKAIHTQTMARTLASTFKWGIRPHLVATRELSSTLLASIQSNLWVNEGGPVILIVDEIGFASPGEIEAMNLRMQAAMGVQTEFGGCALIVIGDFYQLPPVRKPSIYDFAMNYGGESAASLSEDMNRRGLHLFMTMQRYHLGIQMRCDDPVHAEICASLRERRQPRGLLLPNGRPMTRSQYLRQHLLSPNDADLFGPPVMICSPGNPERLHMQLPLAQLFARKRGRRVISWKLATTVGANNYTVEQALLDVGTSPEATALAMRDNPFLYSHFVEGAPMFFKDNISPGRGIANGSTGHLYALQWCNLDVRMRALAFIDQHGDQEDVMLPDGLEPSSVLVEVDGLTEEQRQEWLQSDLTCIPGRVVVPVPRCSEATELVCGRARLNIVVEAEGYDLGLIGTIHKKQGSTVDRITISFLRRPGNPSRDNFFSAYVALTRVRDGNNFRILGNTNDLEFIDKLEPPNKLLAFFDGYDDETRLWNHDRATASLRLRNSQHPRTNNNQSGRNQGSTGQARGRRQPPPPPPSTTNVQHRPSSTSTSTSRPNTIMTAADIDRLSDAANAPTVILNLFEFYPIDIRAMTNSLVHPSVNLAQLAVALCPNVPNRQHSGFFVPFIRSALGLHSPSNVGQLLIGDDNWNLLRNRTASVFQAAGINANNLPWEPHANYGGYIGEHVQTALLNLENGLALSEYWPGTEAFINGPELYHTAGLVFMNLIATQLQLCDDVAHG